MTRPVSPPWRVHLKCHHVYYYYKVRELMYCLTCRYEVGWYTAHDTTRPGYVHR